MKEEGNGVDSNVLPTYALQEGQVDSRVGGDNKFSFGFIDNEMNVRSLRGVDQAIRYFCSFPESPAVFSFSAVSPVPSS